MSWIDSNVTDAFERIVNGKRYLIHDRESLFTTERQSMLAGVGRTGAADAGFTQSECLHRDIRSVY